MKTKVNKKWKQTNILRKYGSILSIFKINFFLLQGFARYSTDARWHVPHFEKMLYDQAQLVVAYSYAFQATQDSKFKAIVEDILTYVNRDLSHPLGGFFRYNIHIKLIFFCINKFRIWQKIFLWISQLFSAEDADSKPNSNSDHKIEGAFCVWTHDELEELLKKELFKGSYILESLETRKNLTCATTKKVLVQY